MSRQDRIRNDIINIIKLQNRHISASGIIQILVTSNELRRKKHVGNANNIGHIMRKIVGEHGIIAIIPTSGITRGSREYFYDEAMHMCHDIVSFSKFIEEGDDMDAKKV